MEQPKPSLWETLASPQEDPPQNNSGWGWSDGWGLSLNTDDSKRKSAGQAMSCSQKEPNPHSWTHQSRSRSTGCSRSRRNSRSPAGDLRQNVDIGSNWSEESPSAPYRGRNEARQFRRYREPCRDLRSNGKEEVSRSPKRPTPNFGREASRPDWAERNPEEICSLSLNANLSKYARSQEISTVCTNSTQVENENEPGLSSPRIKFPDLNDEARHNGCGPCSPVMTRSRSKSSLPQEVNKSGNGKESDGWGLSSVHVDPSRSRSPAAVHIKQNSDSKETEGWGKALDRTGFNAWNQTKSNEILLKRGSDRRRDGHSSSRSRDRSISTERSWKRAGWDSSCSPEHKWRKTRQHLDRSRGSEHSVSPENRSRRTGWGPGRSRGRGSTGPPVRCLNRFNRSQGMNPTSAKRTKDGRVKQSGFSSPQSNQSDLKEKTGSDRWNQTSPNVDDSISRSPCQWSQVAQESTKHANQKESDGWGTNSSPVKNSRSRSVSPWSQAARDINNCYSNKETHGWGKDLNQTGPDAWSQPRSNISPDGAFKRRRGGWGLRDGCRSPETKLRRTGQDFNRTRGRDNSYSPNNRQRRSEWYRGRGYADSPKRCQNRRERRSPLNSPIGRCRESPNLQRSPSCVPRMDQDRDKRDDKKTNDGANAAKVPSWECPKWHDWSVNALRSSVRDLNFISNWGDSTDTRHRHDPNATRTAASHPEVVQTSTECKVSGAAGIEHSMDGTTNLPLSYDPWNNDAFIPSSDAMGALSANPEASQCLSSQKNSVMVSSTETRKSMFCGHQSNASTSILTSNPYPPFKYPTLEPKISIAATSSFSNCSEQKSNFMPIGGGPPQMPMWNLNTPTTSNGVDSAARPSEKYASCLADLPVLTSSRSINTAIAQVAPLCSAAVSADVLRQPVPVQPKSDDVVISSIPSANLEGQVLEPNTDLACEFTSFASQDTKAGVSQARGRDAKTDLCPVTPLGPALVVSKAGPSEIIQYALAGFSSNAVTQPTSCTGTEVGTSRTRGLDTEAESSAVNPVGHTPVVPKVALSQRNRSTVVAGCSGSNTDAVMPQPTSCTDTKVGTSQARGTDAQAEFSTFNPVGLFAKPLSLISGPICQTSSARPTPVVPKVGRSQLNRNSIIANGPTAGAKIEEVDIVNFKLAMAGFAKPKLRPFWLKRYLTDETYQQLLEKFVENVTRPLDTRAPQAYKDSSKFIKEENVSLSKFLQMCLGKFVSEEVIKNMRDEEMLDKPLVFP